MVADNEPMDPLPELIYAAHLLRAIGSRVPFPVALAESQTLRHEAGIARKSSR